MKFEHASVPTAEDEDASLHRHPEHDENDNDSRSSDYTTTEANDGGNNGLTVPTTVDEGGLLHRRVSAIP